MGFPWGGCFRSIDLRRDACLTVGSDAPPNVAGSMTPAKTMSTVTAASGISPVERLHTLVAADMAATEKLIHERMGSAVELIPTLARHLVDSGGKRLRPLLTLASAKMG